MNRIQSIMLNLSQWLASLAAVTAVPVGRDDDGLVLRPSGTQIDKPWGELFDELNDARTAWSQNPLARRLIGLITAYTVGNGIQLKSDRPTLQRFLNDFWTKNRMDLRVAEWSDELARSGEIFPVLFTNPISGDSQIRAVPACLIEAIDFDEDDYEIEIRFKETQPPGIPEKWWLGPGVMPTPSEPLMLHYAVNRPIGAIRGESDLAPMLPWLKRYSRWLEDRVRLNAATRAFLWIVKAPARLRTQLEERYRRPPEPGSVIIADDTESWEAVTPNLNATDAERDGRAIRWMIVAGGPGTALLDLGEGEDSNLATGKTMAEQRRRFLRRRQSYLAWMLTDIALHAWNRSKHARLDRGRMNHQDIEVVLPDISPEDNTELASAASQLASSLTSMKAITGDSEHFRTMALRLFIKFAGEQLPDNEFDSIIQEGETQEENRNPGFPPEENRSSGFLPENNKGDINNDPDPNRNPDPNSSQDTTANVRSHRLRHDDQPRNPGPTPHRQPDHRPESAVAGLDPYPTPPTANGAGKRRID